MFDDVDGLGTSLGTYEILPALDTLTPAGVGYPGAIGRSIVFSIEGSIDIEQLTYSGLVVPEPGTFIAVVTGLVIAYVGSRRRHHLAGRQVKRHSS